MLMAIKEQAKMTHKTLDPEDILAKNIAISLPPLKKESEESPHAQLQKASPSHRNRKTSLPTSHKSTKN